MNAAYNEPVLINKETLSVKNSKSFCVLDTHIVTEIFLAWKLWIQYEDLWIFALKSIELLLDDMNKCKIYNVKMLSELEFLEKLKNICLECKQEADVKSFFSPIICHLLISIFRKILKAVSDVHAVVTIADLLLLLHPAALTYVQHSPSGFYFNPSWRE